MDIIGKILSFIDKNSKIFFYILILIYLIAGIFILYKYIKFGYILNKNITLSGGEIIFFYYTHNIYTPLYNYLSSYHTQFSILVSGNSYTIELPSNFNVTPLLNYLNSLGISSSQISVQTYNSYLGNIIFEQFTEFVLIAMFLVSFILFLFYRKNLMYLPILLTIAFDILLIVFVLSLINYPVGSMAFIAMLMVLGFAIDNNVVLATNIIREKDKPFIERVKISFRVGFLMELFVIILLLSLLFIVHQYQIQEFSFVLLLGALFDIYFYLFGNIPIYKEIIIKKIENK